MQIHDTVTIKWDSTENFF